MEEAVGTIYCAYPLCSVSAADTQTSQGGGAYVQNNLTVAKGNKNSVFYFLLDFMSNMKCSHAATLLILILTSALSKCGEDGVSPATNAMDLFFNNNVSRNLSIADHPYQV